MKHLGKGTKNMAGTQGGDMGCYAYWVVSGE